MLRNDERIDGQVDDVVYVSAGLRRDMSMWLRVVGALLVFGVV